MSVVIVAFSRAQIGLESFVSVYDSSFRNLYARDKDTFDGREKLYIDLDSSASGDKVWAMVVGSANGAAVLAVMSYGNNYQYSINSYIKDIAYDSTTRTFSMSVAAWGRYMVFSRWPFTTRTH